MVTTVPPLIGPAIGVLWTVGGLGWAGVPIDAVVEAGIRESRRLYAKAAVRHGRVQEEGRRLREKLETLRADADAI